MKLRNMATAILFLSSVSLCSAAVPPELRNRPGDKAQLPKGSTGPNSPQTGGDNIGNATVIPSLPYTDTGGTCGATDDYMPSCFSSGAPDVVYAYTPTVTEAVTISLCVGSNYDTGLYVYEGGPGLEIACNDDFCSLQSRIENLLLQAGTTYYIVVDGYSSACGTYG